LALPLRRDIAAIVMLGASRTSRFGTLRQADGGW
jgi:hypothetical protein